MENMDGEQNFYERIKKVECSEEELKKIIEVFSAYLNMSNSDYKYNEPYLNKYTQSFCDVLVAIKDKHPIFDKLSIFLYTKYHEYLYENDKIELIIDGFWKCVITNGTCQAIQCVEVDWQQVCSEKSDVKCIYLKNAFAKHIFMSNKNLVLQNELNPEAIEEIKKELDSFLEGHLMR